MKTGALLLAAGLSRRMGAPKLIETRGGRTLAEHALDSLLAAQFQDIVVVTALEPSVDALLPARRATVRWLVNPLPEAGLSGSLRLGLGAFDPKTVAVLVALADMPAVRVSTVRALLAAWAPDRVAAAPWRDGRRGNPVLVRLDWAQAAAARLPADHGLGADLQAAADQVVRVEVDDPGVLFDVDTPEALAVWRGADAC